MQKFIHPLSKGTFKNHEKVGCWEYSYGHSKQFGHYFKPNNQHYNEWVREECYDHKNDVKEIKISSAGGLKYMDGKYDYKNMCYTGEWRLFDWRSGNVIDKQNVGKCNKHVYQK